ncbi:putative adhesin [Krasilnikovia cinnamomea]|uniref:Putative adhesin n=1 Tax=Krasilnikovia cinnamomea TaxID=349313 RepID=A0A4Q7ZPG3_9ACTN|nr:DUF4097 family beta strand repeat-containing protein [Krasilnikovia cinnamomea]RZU52614.1 putative adhesin [Krasilnikovia cinnamomea]
MNPTLIRRAGAFTLMFAAAAALSGCGGIGAQLTFHDVEKVKVTEIRLTGSVGDVAVRTSAIGETRITRLVRSGTDPAGGYSLDGTVLTLDTNCGPDCTVSYDVEAPAGVAVRGGLRSGDITLTGVGPTDVSLTSGDIVVHDAAADLKAVTTSGNISVEGGKGPATLRTTSGDLRADRVGGPVQAKSTSGDVTVELAAPGPVTAEATSGDVLVRVPEGSYHVQADSRSGESRVEFPDDPKSANVITARTTDGNVTVQNT